MVDDGGGRSSSSSSAFNYPSKKNDASSSLKPNQPFLVADSSFKNGHDDDDDDDEYASRKRPLGGTTMVAGGHHVVGGDGLINTKVYNINEYPWNPDRSSYGRGGGKGQQGVRQDGRHHQTWSDEDDDDYYHSGGSYNWPPYGGINGNRRVIPDYSTGDTASASSLHLRFVSPSSLALISLFCYHISFLLSA